jgi:hypothetical protein
MDEMSERIIYSISDPFIIRALWSVSVQHRWHISNDEVFRHPDDTSVLV